MRAILRCLAVGSVACGLFGQSSASPAQEKYKSFEDARSEGGRLLRNQQLAEAQAPLEAALRSGAG